MNEILNLKTSLDITSDKYRLIIKNCFGKCNRIF